MCLFHGACAGSLAALLLSVERSTCTCSVAWAGSASGLLPKLPKAAMMAACRLLGLLFCCLLVFMFPILVLVPIYERLSVVGTRMRTAHERAHATRAHDTRPTIIPSRDVRRNRLGPYRRPAGGHGHPRAPGRPSGHVVRDRHVRFDGFVRGASAEEKE